jgi:hypothetical protein
MPLTWPQFLKLVAAQRKPAPAHEDHGDAETPHTEAYFQNLHLAATQPSAARKRARTRKTHAERCEPDRDHGEPERLLTEREITRFLQIYTSESFRERRRVLITAIAEWSNLHKDTVYEARRGCPTNKYGMSQRVRTVLSRTITHIEKRGMSFKRSGMQWEFSEHPPPPHTPTAASLQPSPADHKVIPHRIGELVVNIVHGW